MLLPSGRSGLARFAAAPAASGARRQLNPHVVALLPLSGDEAPLDGGNAVPAVRQTVIRRSRIGGRAHDVGVVD